MYEFEKGLKSAQCKAAKTTREMKEALYCPGVSYLVSARDIVDGEERLMRDENAEVVIQRKPNKGARKARKGEDHE